MNHPLSENRDGWRQPAANFSFRYGGNRIAGFPESWSRETREKSFPMEKTLPSAVSGEIA